jgi:hypothetical protein
MHIRENCSQHKLNTSNLQEDGASNTLPAQMIVSSSRGYVESCEPTKRKLYSSVAEEFVGPVPNSNKPDTHAVFGKQIQIEIKDRLVAGWQHVSATDLVLLVSAKAQPDKSDESTFLVRTQTDRILPKPRFFNLGSGRHEGYFWIPALYFADLQLLRKPRREQRFVWDRLNHEFVNMQAETRRQLRKQPVDHIEQPSEKTKISYWTR